MKRRWIIAGVLLVAGVLCTVLLWPLGGNEKQMVADTRQALRAQGFKTDLSEFDFSASDDSRARAARLTRGEFTGPGFRDPAYGWRSMVRMGQARGEPLNLMTAVGTDAALVVWRQDKLPAQPRGYRLPGEAESNPDQWSALAESLSENNTDLDAACAAAMSGPIKFNLDASRGSAMLLPHLAALRELARLLGTRTVLELHNHDRDAAWTNVMASTRLVSAWEPEASEVSHMVRFACAAAVYTTTWQALQAGGWSDDRLAALQREWESLDVFKALPETAAFARASTARVCELERQQPMPVPGINLGQLIRSPRMASSQLDWYWRQVRYRNHGSYEDEKGLLLFYRDRELELRRAVQATNWLEMSTLPAATNPPVFQSKYGSRMSAMMNLRQMNLRVSGGGQGLLGRAAQTEARRRLLVTAIALERYHGRHGSYPATLEALVPGLLARPPIDFMDGKPLRYRLTNDGLFVLYSVGLKGVDDGGKMQSPRRRRGALGEDSRLSLMQEADLVWPRPASDAEAKAMQDEEEQQAERQRAAMEARFARMEEQAEAERQRLIEKLLSESQPGNGGQRASTAAAKDPVYRGHPLSQLLRNESTAGTNHLTLVELLTPKQAFAGAESDTALFDVPVSYDKATNVGRIHLLVDGGRDVGTRGEEGERQTCERAANGNCLLGWTTTYDPPGRHAIQVEFICTTDEEKEDEAVKVQGPAVLYLSTNLVQFSAAYDSFTPAGATLYAKLPESNAVYSIELTTPTGAHLKSLTGSTSNGLIMAHWNLIDDHGVRYTNDSFDSAFSVTLPDSGRTQRLKGP